MDNVKSEQIYQELFDKPIALADSCDSGVCFWLIMDVPGFSRRSGVHVDANPNGNKRPRRHRPCLTAGKTNGNEYRVLFLTSEPRSYAVAVRLCNQFCGSFSLNKVSYVFEWRRGATVVLLPGWMIRDKKAVRFCGNCPDAAVLPEGVLDECFVP